jgi:hypothetical protein
MGTIVKRPIVLGVIGLWILAAGVQPGANEKALIVRVLPIRGPAPTDLVVQAFIARDERNRAVTFVLDSEAYYGSSTSELQGDRAPRTQEVRFRQVPAGEYRVMVHLMGDNGERASEVLTLAVL